MTPSEALKRTKAIEAAFERAKELEVVVGITEDKANSWIYNKVEGDDDSGISVLQVGSIHEYGLGDMPRRSFLRVPIDEAQDRIEDRKNKLFSQMMDLSLSVEDGFEALGEELTNISKESWDNNNWVANKPETIARKGSSMVLFDKGNLKGAITYEVRDVT